MKKQKWKMNLGFLYSAIMTDPHKKCARAINPKKFVGLIIHWFSQINIEENHKQSLIVFVATPVGCDICITHPAI